MATQTAKVGPGGTAFLTRPNPAERNQNSWEERAVDECQHLAYRLRQAVEDAQAARAAGRFGAGEVLELERSQRQQFWIDTCRDVIEMRVASTSVLDLHQKYGCRFLTPSFAQVQQILDALDSAIPFWDRDHRELFYRTLELNFPELLRDWRHRHRR